MMDLEDKILELRRIIHDKEFTIQDLEKIKHVPDKDKCITKLKEVFFFIEKYIL